MKGRRSLAVLPPLAAGIDWAGASFTQCESRDDASGVGSCFGPGMKAGGPNYVAQFMRFASATPASSGEASIEYAVASIERWCKAEFNAVNDQFRLLGQDNVRRYLPLREVTIRVHQQDSEFDVAVRIEAAGALGCIASRR